MAGDVVPADVNERSPEADSRRNAGTFSAESNFGFV
jgi:hypothetical protein